MNLAAGSLAAPEAGEPRLELHRKQVEAGEATPTLRMVLVNASSQSVAVAGDNLARAGWSEDLFALVLNAEILDASDQPLQGFVDPSCMGPPVPLLDPDPLLAPGERRELYAFSIRSIPAAAGQPGYHLLSGQASSARVIGPPGRGVVIVPGRYRFRFVAQLEPFTREAWVAARIQRPPRHQWGLPEREARRHAETAAEELSGYWELVPHLWRGRLESNLVEVQVPSME